MCQQESDFNLYRQWLEDQVEYWRDRMMQSAAERGYPGKRYAVDKSLEGIFEAYEECLNRFNNLTPLLSGGINNERNLSGDG